MPTWWVPQMVSVQLRTDESTTLIEELLQLSIETGTEGAVLFGGVLVLYLVSGVIATSVVSSGVPYPLFSFEADPVLLFTSTAVGIFTVQAAGSLLLYQFYVGVTHGSTSAIALSLVALGIGGGLLRMTLPVTWGLLLGHLGTLLTRLPAGYALRVAVSL